MIISVSRRTDIPAFYSDWFFNRLKDGEVYIRNPFNKNQVSKVLLNKDLVDIFVFWTKDPFNMMKNFKILEGYNYYFQFTLTSYRNDIECNTRKKSDIIKTFIELSNKIGREKVIWRYDPILLNQYYTKEYHYTWFEKIAKTLKGYTNKCVISFVDDYKAINKNSADLNLKTIASDDMRQIAKRLVEISKKYEIEIESCAEHIDLSDVGVIKGACIDSNLISKITGLSESLFKEDNMRKECKCVKSIDIGEYNSCMHKCKYCYANYNSSTIQNNFRLHHKDSKILIGKLSGKEKITLHNLCKERKPYQISFLGD